MEGEVQGRDVPCDSYDCVRIHLQVVGGQILHWQTREAGQLIATGNLCLEGVGDCAICYLDLNGEDQKSRCNSESA